MERFLWFNVKKLRTDCDYFLITFLFLTLVQVVCYFPINKLTLKYIILGIIHSILYLYIILMKKEFTLKDLWKGIS